MGKFKGMLLDDIDNKIDNLDDKYDYDVELEMRISYFLDGGGTELGYTENEYPDPADFEDVIINEIKLEVYKQLTFGDE